MLYLIATPIGNLGDFSIRAVEVLKKVDWVFCEDTRRSSILLHHYGIDKKLSPHHKFNEKQSLESILQLLEGGKEIALLSDAGTPCINDPGFLLVEQCVERKIPFTAIPGPCSLINALVLSGFPLHRFQSIGFLPKKGALEALRSIARFPGTTIILESPERIVATLELFSTIDPQRNVAVVREMTKTFEECVRGTAEEVARELKSRSVLGEICLVIAPGNAPTESLSVEELIAMLQDTFGVTLKEAIPMAAKLLQKPKREIYRNAHNR